MLEVLAPVGNIQSLKAAIYAGADAVYLGLDLFNARIKADNFNKDNIAYWVNYCHLFGVKVYLTFNTNIKQSEREIFAQYVDISAKSGVDAFIVTDLGCLDILKRYDIPLHGSTQIGVHNLAGAKVLEDLGFTRVVLARETLSSDIKQIRDNTNLEIEHFVHGALCVSFSGSCLMSSMMSGDSGNRGRCNQPCRLKYSSDYSSKESYLLSPKDQCLIDKIGELEQLGVYSLKIEGRLKQPHYVGEVVTQYRRAVDNYLYNKNEKIDLISLKTAYNRGNFTCGYNYDSSKDIMFDKINGNIGVRVGKVISSGKGKAILSLSKELKKGDGVKIICKDQEIGGFAIGNINKIGKNYQVSVNNTFPSGSEVYLTSDSRQIERFNNINPKLSIDFYFAAKKSETITLAAKFKDIVVKVSGDVAQISKNQSADFQSISKQLLRLGDSIYQAQLHIDIDENLFIPASSLNNLRREAVEELSAEIIKLYELNKQRVDYKKQCAAIVDNKQNNANIDSVFVEIESNEDSIAFLESINKKVNLVLKYDLNTMKIVNIITDNHLIKKNILGIYLKLPRVARCNDFNIIENNLLECCDKIDGILADNLYGIYLAKKYGKALIGGIGLNIYNCNYAREVGLDYYINSVELSNKELCRGMTYAYGLLPVMTLLHCPIQINTGCDCNNCKYEGKFSYYDRRGAYLLERTKLAHCQFTLYNQQIVDIRNKILQVEGNYYINLCGCKNVNMTEIVNDFINKSGKSDENSTYGHLFRGVK